MSVLLSACEQEMPLDDGGSGIVIEESEVEVNIDSSVGDEAVAGTTVIDSDLIGGTFSLVAASYSIIEGTAVSVTVTRSNANGEASVSYGTHGVTAVSDTRNGDDYAGFDPIVLVFADGENSKSVTVQTLDNSIAESDETFEVYLRSPSDSYTLSATAVTTVTITDNDEAIIDQTAEQSNTSGTGTAPLSWSAPVTKADGTPLSLSEIAGYRLYVGSSSDNLLLVDDINNQSITDYAFTELSQGTHYFAVTVYDTSGDESEFSNIESKTIS